MRLAAGKRGGILTELQISQADVHQGFQLLSNLRNIFEDLQSFLDGHIQQVRDGIAFVTHRKSFGIVAAAATDLTGDIDIGEEIHLNSPQAATLAGFTATALYIEAEAPRAVAAFAR